MIGPALSVAHADPFRSTALLLLRAVRAGTRCSASRAGAAASAAVFARTLLSRTFTAVLARTLLGAPLAGALLRRVFPCRRTLVGALTPTLFSCRFLSSRPTLRCCSRHLWSPFGSAGKCNRQEA